MSLLAHSERRCGTEGEFKREEIQQINLDRCHQNVQDLTENLHVRHKMVGGGFFRFDNKSSV